MESQLTAAPRCQGSPELDVKVGQGQNARRWRIHKKLICQYSSYFHHACNSGFSEGHTGRFNLAEDNPAAFAYFVHWLYSWKEERGKDICQHGAARTWPVMHAAEAWILADKLMAGDFTEFALAQFITRVTFDADKNQRETGRAMAIVFKNAMPESALCKFASKWVAWCCQNDYEIVKKFKSKSIPRDDRDLEDPRPYEFDHWNKECSNISPSTCSHKVASASLPILKVRYRWRQTAKSGVRHCIKWISNELLRDLVLLLCVGIIALFTVRPQC
jgi:hypothetical protein